ncbi:hypothetical protein YC2023_099980 [Brassica napus]
MSEDRANQSKTVRPVENSPTSRKQSDHDSSNKLNSVIHEFIIAGRANHYMPSLKAGSIIWFGKSVLSRALTLPKKQPESLSVSSLIRKKQSTHNSLYIIIYIVLASIIKNISYPKYVAKIQDKISTDTKAATTSPPAYSSCLIKTAYMPNTGKTTQNSKFTTTITLANIEMKQKLCPQPRACTGKMPPPTFFFDEMLNLLITLKRIYVQLY